jgi:two-component system CheB/CheR fusion protein
MPLFHYALNPGGMLFLGTSETVGEFVDLFATMDRKLKLYQRREVAAGVYLPGFPRLLPEAGPASRPSSKPLGENKLPVRELTERALLQQCAPPSALVNERGHIFYLHGRTGNYLEPAPGEAGLNILKMAREGLRRDLTAALHKAVTLRAAVRHPGVRVKTNGDFTSVNVTVLPVPAGPDLEATAKLFLVIFEDAPPPTPPPRLRIGCGRRAGRERCARGCSHCGAEAGTTGQGGIPPDHQRGIGDLQRGAKILQ